MFIGVPREKSHWKSWQSNPPDQTSKQHVNIQVIVSTLSSLPSHGLRALNRTAMQIYHCRLL